MVTSMLFTKLTALTLYLVFLLSAHSAFSWQFYKASGALKIEYQQNAQNLLEIRAITTANSSIGAFLHLLEDTNNISSWVDNAQKAEILSQPDAHSHIVQTYFSAPWPVSPRDMITQSQWTQNPVSRELIMHITDLGQQYPPVKGFVRMQHVQGQWTLTPQANGMLRIQYQGQADPAGKLPRFISDKVALQATFTTFKQLPEALAQYQRPYPNITEP
jgi:hypothetical protein